MDSSSGPTVFGSEQSSIGEDNPEKTRHPKASKWYASSYGTKYTSDPEMLAAVERLTNDSTYEISNANHENGIRTSNQQAVSVKSVSSTHKRGSSKPPLHFGRVAVELSTIKDITRGIRTEVSTYSNLERRYVSELEKKLPQCEGMGDIRMHMTLEQLERIRRYRRYALAELTDMTVRIAALESRVERIAFEAAEAELNAKLVELEPLYCDPEMDVVSPSTSIISTTAAPTNVPKTEPSANTPQAKLVAAKNPSSPNDSRTKYVVTRPGNIPNIKESRLIQPTTQFAKGNILNANSQEIMEQPNQGQIQSQIENTRLHIPSSISTVPTTNMSDEQIKALRELLTDYKNKKAETLSTSETDKVIDNDSTSSVDSGSLVMVMHQPQQLENEEDDGESIGDLLKEARESRNRLLARSIMVSTRVNGNNEKLVIAAVAGSSVAAAILMLEARTGMISKAFSGMLRMLG